MWYSIRSAHNFWLPVVCICAWHAAVVSLRQQSCAGIVSGSNHWFTLGLVSGGLIDSHHCGHTHRGLHCIHACQPAGISCNRSSASRRAITHSHTCTKCTHVRKYETARANMYLLLKLTPCGSVSLHAPCRSQLKKLRSKRTSQCRCAGLRVTCQVDDVVLATRLTRPPPGQSLPGGRIN